MRKHLALLTISLLLAACSGQTENRASLASNDAQWDNLTAPKDMAFINGRQLVQMR